MRSRRTLAAVAGALALAPAAAAEAQSPSLAPLSGDTQCRYGLAHCTRHVPGLVDQFRSLRDHGDPLGFHLGRAPDVSLFKHWQGIQRLQGAGGRHMVVSRSGAGTAFAVVSMSSRPGGGERLRSNRLGSRAAVIAPPERDVAITTRPSPAGMDHAGGIQTAGDYLAMGVEGGAGSEVQIWNFADPTRPALRHTIPHVTGTKGAGTASIARLADRRYLLIVGGTNANTLDFYVSAPASTPATRDWTHVATWNESQLRSAIPGDREFGNYQSLNLLTDETGRLHLVGTHKDSVRNTDWADLFTLTTSGANTPVITKIAKRHLYCGIPSVVVGPRTHGGRQCDLDAAGGVHVSPSGRLLLYGTEHDNDGPGGTVKAMEFRGAPHRTSCDSIQDAWVELYDDRGFDGDRGVMIDYADRAQRDYENYDRVEGFEDKASAGMWCLPRGWRYRLYEDKNRCGGDTVDLVGTGRPQRDADFDDRSGAVRRFGDEVSCSRFVRG